MQKHDPMGFRSVSIREDLYQEMLKFLEINKEELEKRRIRNPSQLTDASARCFIACERALSERKGF